MSLLLPMGVLVLSTALTRLLHRSWLEPGAFVGLYWTLFTTAALVLRDLFPVRPIGLWVIAWFVVVFQAGAWLAGLASSRRGATESLHLDPTLVPVWLIRRVRIVLAALSAMAAVGVVGQVWGGLFRFGLSWSAAVVLQLGRAFSVERYGVGEATPTSIRLLLYCVYPAAALGGHLAALRRGRADLMLAILPLVLTFTAGLVVASRAGLLISVFMWTGTFLATKVAISRGSYSLVRPGTAAAVAAVAGGLSATYLLFQWIRTGVTRQTRLDTLVETALASVFAPVAVFGEWLRTNPDLGMTLGAFTFAGPFNLFGLATRELGLYTEAVYFPSGESSNIYSMLRGLLEDFGVAGAGLVVGAAGFGMHAAYRACAAARLQWVPLLALSYCVVMFSVLSSIFVYNSPTTGWLIVGVVWIWPPLWRRHDV